MKVMFFAMLVLCFNACYLPELMQKDESKYNKLRMQSDCETKIYDTSVPKHYFDTYYFTNNLNAIEIRDYIFSKDTRQSNVYHKVIHGDEVAKLTKDSNYQAFLKQIVVEYTEMRVDKKTMITKQIFTFKSKNTQNILAQVYDYNNYIQKFKVIRISPGIFQRWRTLDEICRDIRRSPLDFSMACSCKMGRFEDLLSPDLLQIVKRSCKNANIEERSKNIWCQCLESYKNNSLSPVYRVPIEWEK